MNKQQRYEELRDRLNLRIDTGEPAISDEEDEERIRLHYELNTIELPDLTVPLSITSSDPSDGGITIHPKKRSRGAKD